VGHRRITERSPRHREGPLRRPAKQRASRAKTSRDVRTTPSGTQFAAGAAVGLAGVLVTGVAFALILALVAARWQPLRTIDAVAVNELNGLVATSSSLVSVLHFLTDLGGAEAAWLVLPTLTAWLLLRRSLRLAAYVAVTGLGILVLNWGTKALIGRVRPLVEVPIANAPGPSFPALRS
jgi:hypothetical protein